ncbi:hypothetical protein A7U60_g8362 [Sanghuangporus baumii]|uniref:DUF7962 domain-containing protein n=1 Tax=Sanghuangporus baumii TaxID=108892 RepID=A0A9Q5N4G4_SANBA|nr:hypothetical protein A7U60_g8362 [Sanghuangporus baumii]
MMLPRPEITDALGIGYRRIPILAIGNDVFCDTNLIVSAVERCFPVSQGFPTLFPDRKDGGKGDTGIIELLAAFYVDRPLFSLASTALPYDKFSPEFIEDRSKLFGTPMDIQKMVARKPVAMSLLSSHMNYLEKQLSDGREWIFDTTTVGYADLDLHHIFGWIMRFRGMKQVITPEKFPRSIATYLEKQLSDGREWVFDTTTVGYADLDLHHIFGWIMRFRGMKQVITPEKFPRSIAWMQRMAEFEKAKREANAPDVTKIDGSAAAKIIADNADERLNEVSFDQDEAKLLGLKLGEKVQVIPDDNYQFAATNYPTIGDLVGFSREEMVLRLEGTAVSSLCCHFPRLNYTVTPVAPASSKL